jgi:glycosyltransferase involved in cell wall biosynthesis
VFHSVLIPHRNRNLHLEACLQSVQRSAEACLRDRDSYEVLVLDDRSAVWPRINYCDRARLIEYPGHGDVFNKCAVLNHGIAQAQGDVITFLDADAIVGEKWLAGPLALALDKDVTRLCYRVRTLPENMAIPARSAIQSFNEWEKFEIRYEARVRVDTDRPAGEPLFGNSQFSITREKLGDLRFNEEFKGGGYEDLWFIREIWRRFGSKYKAVLLVDAEHAMFHIQHKRTDQPGWRSGPFLTHNRDLYYAT